MTIENANNIKERFDKEFAQLKLETLINEHPIGSNEFEVVVRDDKFPIPGLGKANVKKITNLYDYCSQRLGIDLKSKWLSA